ncbi:hypothetical protein HC251_10605 [Iamia sp. SCSIO 61187]|uniref:hypothetical protein n=1 Tax=Iamia sp. SCSIO 61187 TaxID=2722752 RepID=UPI001C631401|nr:hypothetical protein [Iamia sp. SCSIO 61187]QYG92836.1 hypothetical protein HC251_10605 [Iamia sp. SCSIO 61187]
MTPAGVARRVVLAVLALVTVLGAAAPAGAQDGGDDEAVAGRPGRVLVVSIPGLTWADVAEHELPHLEELFAQAAVADLAPRAIGPRATPGEAYLTISAGTRAATEPSVDGQVLALDEESSGSAAGEIFSRRTGVRPDGPYVSLSWPVLVAANADEPYDAEPGLLADTLLDAEVTATVIGNADGTESIGPSYERQVGLALTDTDGVVPNGHLGKDLLVPDVAQPFGLRTDIDAVADRFGPAWAAAEPGPSHPGGGLVLVEASDTARVLRYRSTVDAGRYDELWTDALGATDQLVARLMEDVDLARDTVVVVAPYNRRGDRDLTVAAMAGAGIDPGYLRSGSSQRAGFLTLADVAPTLLDRFDIPRPTSMEGRPALAVDTSDGPAERIDHLVSLNDASRFRERLLTPTTTVVVLLLAVCVALGLAAHTNGWSARARGLIAFAALWDLAILPASYLARAFPLEEQGARFYWLVVVLISLAVAAGATAVARWRARPRLALVIVLAVVGGVIVGDVVTGSRLSLSAAFGYSPTGNSRLYGVSNYSYGQIAVPALLLAAWVAAVRAGRTGRVLATALLLATVVVIGLPTWGADVGGVLAFTPALLVFGLVLSKRRIRLRALLMAGLVTLVAIVAFGLLDLARPPGDRAHLGRLFERVGEEGLGPLLSLVERKLAANLQVSTESLWVAAIPIALALWVYLVRFPTRPLRRLTADLETLPAALAGTLVAAVLGSALNDSGAIVGGVAALVLAAALVVLLMDVEGGPPTARAEVAPPDAEGLPATGAEAPPDAARTGATPAGAGATDRVRGAEPPPG